MREILRNLSRRKLRSTLTVSGIVIGIFALTTMGALAEHFNSLLDLGVQYSATAIRVGPPDGQQTALIPLSKGAEIARVAGVAAVYPTYQISAQPGGAAIQMGPPDMITNENPSASAYGAPATTIASGRDLAPDERGQVVLGAGIAGELGKKAGDVIDLPVRPKNAKPEFVNHRFTVAGLMPKTGNAVDSFAFVGDPDARMLLRDTLPPTLRDAVDVNKVAQGFAVYSQKGASLSELDATAARINQQVVGVQTQKPSELVASFKSTGTTFTAIITGAAILALIIGGLSVVNTMIMAVAERVREIGLKKALGAHTRQVLVEYLLEAAVIGALGGSAGFLLGLGLTTAVDHASSSLDIFLVTPRLTLLSLGFAIGMATLAGIIPAVRAARLDPVSALRSQS